MTTIISNIFLIVIFVIIPAIIFIEFIQTTFEMEKKQAWRRRMRAYEEIEAMTEERRQNEEK